MVSHRDVEKGVVMINRSKEEISMEQHLLVGTAEIDITPPVGTALAGALKPKISEGIADPLYVKAIVLESHGAQLAYVVLDLIKFHRKEGDRAVTLASRQSGIPEQNIVWAATHTHCGPYLTPNDSFGRFGQTEEMCNQAWIDQLPQKIADCVTQAKESLEPARMNRLRALNVNLSQNRRIRFKDGRQRNTWLLGAPPAHWPPQPGAEEFQSLGSAGPTDPEIGILSFENPQGTLLAVLFQFALHTNTHNHKLLMSSDYPAVVAARLRERFGPQVSTLFMLGPCADLNRTGGSHREVGDALAQNIIQAIENRGPGTESVPLNSIKRECVIPYRDLSLDQEDRVRASLCDEEGVKAFRQEIEIMRREGVTESKTLLQAWRIGA